MTALARTVMVQGTASGVGKSLLVAALCRLLRRRGLEVRPFKAQNMALNAAVTADGGEVGRAQALQALACGVDVVRAMNPILLKPEGDRTAQVVVDGEVLGRMDAAAYHALKPRLWPVVTAALDGLRRECDVVVIEGAGSPAEVNLRDRDIVNMRVAAHAGAPVLLVGDIDRGGVFAALLGTLALLRPAERRRVAGLVVNNFRGDPALFRDGAAFLERRARLPVLGVVPHLAGLRLAQEDSLGLAAMNGSGPGAAPAIDVALVGLPRISNFDDCDPLLRERGVAVRLVDRGAALGDPDLVVLPGTKTSLADLDAVRDLGLDTALRRARRRGSALLGICGGMQLLGRSLDDPAGSDGGAGSSTGLGLLPTSTVMSTAKVVRRVRGEVRPVPGLLAGAAGAPVRGYEIHAGRTAPVRPALRLWPEAGGEAGDDGATSPDGWVVGTHVHGLLEEGRLRRALLAAVAARRGRRWRPGPGLPGTEAELDRLADGVDAALDMERVRAMIAPGPGVTRSARPAPTHLLLVLGGARSGKSAYAETRVTQACGDDVLYVATMRLRDGAAEGRVAAHRRRRPARWMTTTVDARGNLVNAVCERARRSGTLLDGFELALALARPPSDAAARTYATRSAAAFRATTADLVCVVSAEVGLGVHPETEAGYVFRDRAGAANQALAQTADEVVLVVAGLPLWLKGGP